MSMTRAQLRALALDYADAATTQDGATSQRWSTTSINQTIGAIQWRNWGKLLNAFNQFTMNTVTPTQDANGQFDVTDLTSGSGDTAKYFYRVQTMSQPNTSAATAQIYYRQSTFTRYPNPQPSTSLPYVWYRFGSKIQILPAVSGTQMSVVVNYRPPRADQLSADNVTVDYPDGYETGLAYEAAAIMLRKGGAEQSAANDLMSVATQMFEDMLLDLGRASVGPIIALAHDSPEDWAGGVW